jgi:hypothetical protein
MGTASPPDIRVRPGPRMLALQHERTGYAGNNGSGRLASESGGGT